MKIVDILNNYTNTGVFSFMHKNGKLHVSYYNELVDFSDNKVVISSLNDKIICKGDNLVIESLFKDLIIINGNIKTISIEALNE